MNIANIITIVNKIPGIRYRELQKITNLPNGTLSYYIGTLVRNNKIKISRNASSTRLFPIYMDDYTASIISVLREDVRLRIVKHLLKHKSATYNDLYKISGKALSTLSWHLDKLIDANIIVVSKSIGMNEYSLKDPQIIEYIIKDHIDTVDNFINMWEEL